MGFFKKIKKVMAGKANQVADKLEENNIEAVVRQTIKEMEDEYRQVKQAVNQSITLKKKVEKKYNNAKSEVKHWEERAKTAVDNDKDGLAKEALEKKQDQLRLAQKYQKQLEERKAAVESHKAKMKELKEKLDQAKDKQEELIAEAKTAQATKEINNSLSGIDETNAFSELEELEDKVDGLQAEAEASDEIYAEETEADLESKFEKLEADSDNQSIEDELAQLKKDMNN
ncbi:PspA/IM30 family protein [Halanaerobacter jeridensis]|uniref:Phage shock protein A n=1 Tax=Halanaerobacter jeridensis TaxID=706427 RepID=A0A938XPJ6_9FIRM|nr:PspA/IM30 family protein [Halanaerobacter jeridensis]MBM7556692.1 phage shock protein A [Halanaerobacter jeridensis]